MKKKQIIIAATLCTAILSTSFTAFALPNKSNSHSMMRSASTSFEFWMENFGPSAYSPDSAYKSSYGSASVSTNKSKNFWPSQGVALRVRNENHKYATEARKFTNGESDDLDYLTNQDYKGTKWLYGSISDSYAEGYNFLISGTWIP